MVGKDGRFYGASHHDNTDTYELQAYEGGRWETVRRCTKKGGANAARAATKKEGIPYRVYNTTKRKVYVECR